MTNKQQREHKKGNQKRRERLLILYHGVSPSKVGWIVNPEIGQKGKYSSGLMLPFLSGKNKAQLHIA